MKRLVLGSMRRAFAAAFLATAVACSPQQTDSPPERRDAGPTGIDHTANANAFAGATWLVRGAERDAMFAGNPPGVTRPSTYSALKTSTATIIDSDEHDVFGDGTVILKLAAGHTPGHQLLYLKLPKTGAIVLSGDLYHFPEARTLKRVAVFDVDQNQTPISRDAVESFLAKTGAQLWIQHDNIANAKLKKAPEYYE